MNDKIKQIQELLGVTPDGIWGPKSQAALSALLIPQNAILHRGYASSFADPADVASFNRCKADGGSDEYCFGFGDNGIGKWGDDCTNPNVPMCALPPEDWEPLGPMARGAKVRVHANNEEIICELRDTMPRKQNIKNGATIDLNPAAVAAFGLKPPIMIPAVWSWA